MYPVITINIETKNLILHHIIFLVLLQVEIQELTAVYYAMIEELDYWVGQLLDRLEASGLDSNTLVVFTSDHGMSTKMSPLVQ